MPSNTLVSILEKHSINGFEMEGGTDKNTTHSYLEIYQKLLRGYKSRKGKLLEIGVLRGGSAILWHDYLKKFELYLMDIRFDIPEKNLKRLDIDRCKFLTLNAYCPEAIQLLNDLNADKFEIIIDDGPHTLESQIFTINHYYDLVREGGKLIIEDVDSENLEKIKDSIPAEILEKTVIYDNRHKKNRFDDILICISK